ncbi:MAG: V-type ATP synthase subunit I [Tissierellia bacterium]|nr:V-type ATP synthase subunit I [Tissierellia bacterium]
MAIVKMSKFSLFAFEEDRKNLLDELQRFEYVHFSDTTDLSESNEISKVQIPESIQSNQQELSKLHWMIDLLKPRASLPTGIKALKAGLKTYSIPQLESEAENIEYENLYDKLKEVTNRLDEINQENSNIKQQIEDLRPWDSLDIKISDLGDGRDTHLIAGTLPAKQLDEVKSNLNELKYTYLQEVSTEKNLNYVIVAILKKEYNESIEMLRKHGFNRISIEGKESPKQEIESLEKRDSQLNSEREDLEKQLDHYTKHLEKLELSYEYLMNQRLKLSATENFLELKDVNITEGFIPTEMAGDFKNLLDKTLGNRYYVAIEDADKNDPDIPILLKNNKFTQTFESITTMYALPKYNEVDPTPFFAIFYWVFFGMMVADAGYGLVVLLGTAFALKAFNLDDKMRKFVGFFFFLSISTIIWGFVYGSAFGISLPFRLIDASSDAIKLLVLSVVFGGIHLFYAMGIQAYMKIRDGKPMDAVYDVLFWYMALMGAIVLLLTKMLPSLPAAAGSIAKWVMIVGMIGIVLFGARDSKKPVGRLVGGLYELYGISSYIGDFVSYSRLMALGLAGGFIAVAINMIIGMLSGSIIGMVFGAVIFVFGHIFNAFLSLLSAYVHTSRLTYVEFFGKFYSGGGKAFNLFKNDAKYINIK